MELPGFPQTVESIEVPDRGPITELVITFADGKSMVVHAHLDQVAGIPCFMIRPAT